ncbi:hypothetical protein CTI12_AA047400 [Artemisia annua]|uniref:Small auxin-up RNA n=1 Tax=Artemisia annua TaxID=35608 RepID=A0A2U1QCL2_ARTAN|nr:hypothetical protein CTI12_AA497590 [Artemisia annua]PWA95746.1 hypothetical protein CTI12_AA047400 [Artemisia annua]
MAVMVGHEGQEQKRFVIPVIYIYHPLFIELLKEAEEEYGFDHRGPINIPCDEKGVVKPEIARQDNAMMIS